MIQLSGRQCIFICENYYCKFDSYNSRCYRMVRPEKGSLADRSDIRNRVRLFRQRSQRVHQADPNPNPQTGNGSNVQQVINSDIFLKQNLTSNLEKLWNMLDERLLVGSWLNVRGQGAGGYIKTFPFGWNILEHIFS